MLINITQRSSHGYLWFVVLTNPEGQIMSDNKKRFLSDHWMSLLTMALGVVSTVATLAYTTGQQANSFQSCKAEIDKIQNNGTALSQKNAWEIEQIKGQVGKLEQENKQLSNIVNDIRLQVSSLNSKYENQEKKMDQIIELLKNVGK
jgi:TolA-binding protein